MRCHLPVILAILSPLFVASDARAQFTTDEPAATQAAAAAGRVEGLVTDSMGRALERVSILALGTALAVVRTDGYGRFSLSLPPGQYVLRAARDGYISTYREAVRVQSDVALTRVITLVRAASAATPQPSAGADGVDRTAVIDAEPADHGHSPTAWRLRHLPQSVLRETAGAGLDEVQDDFDPASASVAVTGLFLHSARAASAFFAGTDFQGQVNFLTTSVLSTADADPPAAAEWARGVAYLVVGAPVGSHGAWSIRAAMAPGDSPSWAFHGEYQASRERSHAFRAGVSYSAHAEQTRMTERLPVAAPVSTRRVGGVYGFDQWTVHPGVTLDYGLQIDRYDYLSHPTLISGRLGVKAQLAPGLAVSAGAAPSMIAPGADQFLPPDANGVWLPPERTFDGLAGAPLEPERVAYYALGIQADLPGPILAELRGFAEQTENQIAILFGFDRGTTIGHYSVGSPGSVTVSGLAVELSGDFSDHLGARVAYTRTAADWHGSSHALSPLATSLRRIGRERGHDLSATIDATVPGPDTRVSVVYRLSNLYSAWSETAVDGTRVDGRYKIEVRQTLPYRPLHDGELNLLVTARTLLREPGANGAFYDELLTVAPPMQVICGLQMRF